MGTGGPEVHKAGFQSATPRWLMLERAFVTASGLSLCIATWIWNHEGRFAPMGFTQATIISAAVAVPYAVTLFALVRSAGHRLLNLAICLLSLVVALFSLIWVLAGLFENFSESGYRNQKLWIAPLIASVCHGSTCGAGGLAFRESGGSSKEFYSGLFLVAALTGALSYVLLK